MSTHRRETGIGTSLRNLQDDAGVDQTLQNLLRALTLNLELRSRYRVFEFEASQDGHPGTAQMFRGMRSSQSDVIAELMAGLHAHLGRMDVTALGERVE